LVPQNFLGCDREQELLLPPSLREWLPPEHLAWFVIDLIDELDLTAFYTAYRADGHGRAAHEPAMMLALIVYAYAIGERSSRRIERRCVEDVAFRVIAANQTPDHATIARFRQRHETALGELFSQVLELCAKAGLVRPALLTVDGTKLPANAARFATKDFDALAREILAEADRVDLAEDAEHGERRGDELPEGFATSEGRRGWIRDARRELERRRDQQQRPVPGDRPARLLEARERLLEEHRIEAEANRAYEHWRATGRMRNGRAFSRRPDPFEMPAQPTGTVNTTDPDSRIMRAHNGVVQGYNAQAVCTDDHVIVAAEVSVVAADFGQLAPMFTAAQKELAVAGVTEPVGTVLADAGYWNQDTIDAIAGQGTTVLVPPDARNRIGTRPGWDGGRYAWMRHLLATDRGIELYARRQATIEPIFADLKFNRRFDRFLRRGRGACRSEWRLAAATYNLLKLHRHHLATA
jgi:transposase